MGSLPKNKKKNIPKSIHEMSKETLQETLKKKKECNAKALQTVERLCETSVDEEWFLNNLQFINQCHFDDATIERAITKICGYPLCNGKLENVPSQQYRISTRYNKVFDITERKNFCSSSCYKSAMHVKEQLFTSPLWFRDQEIIPKYTLLKSMKSSLGEEVVFLPDKIKPEDVALKIDVGETNLIVNTDKTSSDLGDNERLNNLDKCGDELEKNCGDLTISNLDDIKNEVLDESICKIDGRNFSEESSVLIDNKTTEEFSKSLEDVNTNNKENERKLLNERNFQKKSDVTNDKNRVAKPSTDEKNLKSEKTNKTKTKMTNEPVNVIKKIESCIFEWFSIDTLFHLYGEEKLKELFKDKATAIKEAIDSKLSLAGQNDKIDKMIQLYKLLDVDLLSSGEVKTNLKPLPDYSILKEEGKTLEIKVRAFYKGDLQIKKPQVEEKKEETETTDESEPIYLPLIDTHAQTALRRKIVLDKLNKTLPELMKVINSDFFLQMKEVRNLVSTFTLSAHNITFKPTEWCLVGIILLKLLGVKDKKLRSALNLESSKNQISVILLSYELQKDYLEQLLHRLTDSEHLMEKLNEINR